MTRALNVLLIALFAVAAGEAAFAALGAWRSPQLPTTLSDRVRDDIERQYHDCIPLGWYAKRLPSGESYPTVNLDIVDNSTAFQALWVAIVPRGRIADPRVSAVKSVMDQLVDAGLLLRANDPRGERYNVTRYGQRFFYDDAEVSGNAEAWPYVCYTRLHVTRLAWGPPRADGRGRAAPVVRNVHVWWSTQPVADWATPALRAHAIELRPHGNPAETSVCQYVDGEWSMIPFQTMPAPRRC